MKYKFILIFVFLASLLLVTGCGLFPEEDERLSPPIKEASEVEYKTEPVVRMDIAKTISLFAQWKSATKVAYSYEAYNAPFLEYKVSVGDIVKPGDVLAVLDIGDIDKQLRDMDITYQKQKLSYERTLEKYNAGILSEYDLRIAELNFEDVTNRYNDLKEEKAGSLLIADIDGTVFTLMDFDKGETVNTGLNLVSVVKNDDIILQGTATKLRTEPVNVGDRVVIQSQGKTMEGVLSNIRGIEATVEPDSMLDEWVLGSTVKVTIPIDSAMGVLVIDKTALKAVGGSNYVRVLVNGIAVEKSVTLGISSGRLIEIVSGLVEGELVIIN